MTQPTHLGLDALQAAAEEARKEADSWADDGYTGPWKMMKDQSDAVDYLIDRLRKAEAAIAPQPGSAIVRITIPDPEYADVSPGLILEDALRVATYGWPNGVSFEIIAAPDSTPTDRADSKKGGAA